MLWLFASSAGFLSLTASTIKAIKNESNLSLDRVNRSDKRPVHIDSIDSVLRLPRCSYILSLQLDSYVACGSQRKPASEVLEHCSQAPQIVLEA